MKILRETRAKIDPNLLSAMKEKLSAMAPGMLETPSTTKPADQVSIVPKNSARGAAALYSQTAQKTTAAKPAGEDAEPVDRQKVAQIVMEYMKLREESKTRH